ncbi:MAG: hypothetical protein ACI9U2_001553, partial [Bradymonadia bacterium]
SRGQGFDPPLLHPLKAGIERCRLFFVFFTMAMF